MEEFDVVIIGAGVVGLAIASELTRSSGNNNVLVLEKASSFGRETSSRNSEVIHGGMYYPEGTLKARLCVEGRRALYELCEKQNIPCSKIGKLIVAMDQEELCALDKIRAQGALNGVEGLRCVSDSELKKMEPDITGVAAILSEETGIIDSHRLMEYFLRSAQGKGAMVAYNSEVTGIIKTDNGYDIAVKNSNEIMTLKSVAVINCAGLDSDTVAHLAGIDLKRNKYELHYCKGQYFRVKAGRLKSVKRLVYPVPKPKSAGLGIHVTPDLSGAIRLGPDDQYLNDRQKNYSFDNSKRFGFYDSVSKFLPRLQESDLFEDTCGIRPKLQGPGEAFRDFIIKNESENGLPDFINLIGIESPGLTASPAIAKYVKGLLK